MSRAIILSILLFSILLIVTPVLTPNASHSEIQISDQQEVDTASTTSTQTPQQMGSPREYTWYPVSKVIDGDTLVASINGKNITIRLIGIDTPETVDPRKTVQCFGKEASEKARQILSGSSVRLENDPSQGAFDKYGRTLAYVYVVANSKPEGILVNEYMIAEGYGHEYTYTIPYKYQEEFKAAEKHAREAKKGLWADDACARESARPAKTPPPSAVAEGGPYECSRNIYNCSSFKMQSEAQAVFDSCGGSNNDIHKLDSDGDGRVCESLP